MWQAGDMELLEAIYQRRTIKDFKPGEVPDAVIEEVLAAGLWAQNHKLTQPWRFTLLGAETRRALAERFAEAQASQSGSGEAENEAIKATAREKILSKPTLVSVAQKLEGPPSQQREDYGAISCAIQNIQLAAWAQGVGMQWSSGKIILMPQTYDLLGIDPEREELAGLLFFGYPASIPSAPRRKPLAEVLRRLP